MNSKNNINNKSVNNRAASAQSGKNSPAKRRNRAAHRVLFFCLAFICVLTVFIISGKGLVKTTAGEDGPSEKYYVSYCVKGGDTLWSIACENMTSSYVSAYEYIDEIKSINNLSSNNLTAGSSIIIVKFR